MELKEILKNRRKELGLTLDYVAKACDVSEGTVSRWESGNIGDIKRSKILKLAGVLKISPSVIIGSPEDEKDDLQKSIGDKITSARIKKGMSKKQLALALGLSLQALDEIETGKHRNFSNVFIRKVADALGVPASYFLDVEPVADVGRNLKALRDIFEISKEETAEALNVAESDYTEAEDGKNAPSFAMLDAVAELYGIPVAVLVGFDLGNVPEHAKNIIRFNRAFKNEHIEAPLSNETIKETINYIKYLNSK